MVSVVHFLDRPVYGLGQVDRVLGLPGGTARRWIDGYTRAGKRYPPVVREEPTGDEAVTWGEFVETRLLAEYRDAGVPIVRMRPAIDKLREALAAPYPLASARLGSTYVGGNSYRGSRNRSSSTGRWRSSLSEQDSR